MQSTQGILVLGAGGHGKSVVAVLLASGAEVAGVLDDDTARWGTAVQGVPVLGPIGTGDAYPGAPAVLGAGTQAARQAIVARCPEFRWVPVVYPGCYISATARLGEGTVVFPGGIVSADATVGAHCIVSGHTTVGHDVVLEDFVQVAPGVQIAGSVHVGRGAMLGIGSVVAPGIRIGAGAVLAAGAVAVRDVPPGATVFGVPARAREVPPAAG